MPLSEDELDDVLYSARVGDTEALQEALAEASKEHAGPPHDILAAAVDAESGNTALHMAAANGHIGRLPWQGEFGLRGLIHLRDYRANSLVDARTCNFRCSRIICSCCFICDHQHYKW